MKDLQKEFDALLGFENEEERLEHEAQLLAFQFLSGVDACMAKNNIKKKDLASKIGTSAAFITQLFQGDRKPSWNILAKMQDALELEFKIYIKDDLDKLMREELTEYHNKWVKTKSYEEKSGMDYTRAIMSVLKQDDYALAG